MMTKKGQGSPVSYLDISNLYKSQDILLFKEAYALEKIHGTSASIIFENNTVRFFSGGEKHEKFVALFDAEFLLKTFQDNFEIDADGEVVIYGEAYGGKMQAMSHTYGKDLKFIVFDVKVGHSWLNVPIAENVAKKFNLEFVHYEKIPTDLAAIDAQRDADSVQAIRNGVGPGKMREGVVLRPLIEVKKNNGERVICKHKRDEFKERQNVPRVVDTEKLAVMQEAEAIAEEWCVPMRLEHILQELPNATGMEHTRDVIAAMIADVYKEAKGEIVESKEVSNAIGKKTSNLWKKRIQDSLRK
jgi:hypothetical protein